MYKSYTDGFLEKWNANKDRILDNIGKLVVKNIDDETPVDTGLLKSNNDYEVIGETINFRNLTPYAAYVELGTYRMNRRPFFEIGITKSFPEIGKEMDSLKDI